MNGKGGLGLGGTGVRLKGTQGKHALYHNPFFLSFAADFPSLILYVPSSNELGE